MGANGLDRRDVASAACRVGQPVKSPLKKCGRSSTRCISSRFPFWSLFREGEPESTGLEGRGSRRFLPVKMSG